MIENPVIEAVQATARADTPPSRRESMSARQSERAFVHLRNAIKTAEQAVEDARRSLDMYAKKPSSAASAVMHALTWGLANASSSIETAMACIEDAHVVRAMEVERAGKP